MNTRLQSILICLLVLISCLCCWQCSRNRDLKSGLELSSHNLRAVQDTLSLVLLENESLLGSRLSTILEKEQALQALEISKTEYKELEKKLGSNIERISRVETKIVRDTVWLEPSVKTDTLIIYRLIDPYMRAQLSYLRDSESLRLDSLSIPLDLTIGYTSDYRFFVNSSNPYLQINNIKSSLIADESPVTKRHSLRSRLSFGIGAGPGLYYSLTGKGIDIGLGVSVGINLKF